MKNSMVTKIIIELDLYHSKDFKIQYFLKKNSPNFHLKIRAIS